MQHGQRQQQATDEQQREAGAYRRLTDETAHDPLAHFVGGVAHGGLAERLDRELYGDEEVSEE